MGCWNVACEITRLPILENEEAILIQAGGVNGLKNIQLIKSVYCGTYDEYGGLNDEKEIITFPCDFNSCNYYVKKSVWDVIQEMDFSKDFIFKSEKKFLLNSLKMGDTGVEAVLDSLLKVYVFNARSHFYSGGQFESGDVKYYEKLSEIYSEEVKRLKLK